MGGISVSTRNDGRIVTVCVVGSKAKSASTNQYRSGLLLAIALDIKEHGWDSLDCVVLPGGYFRHPEHLGLLDTETRMAKIVVTDYSDDCMRACTMLAKRGRPVQPLIIAGVDARGTEHWRGDEFCVAWDAKGVKGLGRKVFPPPQNPGPRQNPVWYSCEDDFSDSHRLVRLPSGLALLCACYDMYGVRPYEDVLKRSRLIPRLLPHDSEHPVEPDAAQLRRLTEKWRALWRGSARIAVSAVHEDPSAYWQRHGVQRCSAELMGTAVAAAHFRIRRRPLPGKGKLPLVATRGKAAKALDEIRRPEYLIRLFDV